MKHSRIIQGAAGVALAGAGLYLFFRGSGSGGETVFATLAREIVGTSVDVVAACVVLTVLSMWLRAVRLAILLPDGHRRQHQHCQHRQLNQHCQHPPHKKNLFAVMMVTYMMNNILPARLGEAARAVLLWKRNGFPIAVSIGSLLLEHALDVIVYLAFLVLPVLLSPAIAASLKSVNSAAMVVIWVSAAGMIVLTALFVLYALMPGMFKAAAVRITAPLSPKIKTSIHKTGSELESNMDWIFSPAKAAGVTLLTVAICLCFALMLTILARDLKMFGIPESLFAQAFAAFGAAIPLAPGSVGTLHAVLLQGLTVTGLDPGKARAVAVLYHGVQYAVVTGLGLLLFAGMNVRFRDITEPRK